MSETMTAEQAASKLTNIMHDDHYSWHPSILTAFNMAVDALKVEGDLISRKEAIDRIESHLRTGDELYPLNDTDKVLNHGFEIAASCVYNLPSSQPVAKDINVRVKDCISRRDAIDVVGTWFELYVLNRTMADTMSIQDMIRALPSVQPELIRCKDCKHRDPEDHKCDCGHTILWQLPRDDDWFCADAERKEGEADD